MLAFDLSTDPVGHAHEIRAWFDSNGETAGSVGVYLRTDRCSLATIQGLHSVGVSVFGIAEHGHMDELSWFSADQAETDANAFLTIAEDWGWPKQVPLFVAYDGDFDPHDIAAYARVWHQLAGDQILGAYGSGAVITALKEAGLIHYGFRSCSKGFAGYSEDFDITQDDCQGSVLGWGVDMDTIHNPATLWRP